MHHLVAAELATVPENIRAFVPIEGLIDAAIKKLIHKFVVEGSFTATEQRDYDELTMERSRRMMPPRIRSRLYR